MGVDHELEAQAFTEAMTLGGPVWCEASTRTTWLAYDEGTGLKLRLVLRPAGRFRRARWCAYAIDRDGNVAQAVMCLPDLDASIHIAENMAARGRFAFPTEENPAP